jgi:hypothetical protein
VTSYTKWDRDAYIERVGGPEEARTAPQAETMGVTQAGSPRSAVEPDTAGARAPHGPVITMMG